MQKKFRVAITLTKKMANSILSEENHDFLRSFAEINPIEELPEELTFEHIA